MKTKWHEHTVVPNLKWCFCPDAKTYDRIMREIGAKNNGYPETGGCCVEFEHDGEFWEVVTIREDKRQPASATIGLIAHECMHVWRACLKQMRERDPSSEFESYGMHYIIMKVTEDFFASGRKLGALK